MPSLACAAATAAACSAGEMVGTSPAEDEHDSVDAAAEASWPGAAPLIDPQSTFYLINPSGDLPSTQAAFQEWFQGQSGWQVGRQLQHSAG